MNNVFEERQYQRGLIPWLLVAGIWLTSIMQIYKYGFTTENLVYEISILLLLPVAITLLFLLLKLSVRIDKKYLMFKMFPFHWTYRKIKLDEINIAIIKEYNTDRALGWGLGISWDRKFKSYTLKGYKGVEIFLNDGQKIFFGTQQPETFFKSLNPE